MKVTLFKTAVLSVSAAFFPVAPGGAQIIWEAVHEGPNFSSSLLDFNDGAEGTATSGLPSPPFMATGVYYSSDEAGASSGGWDLTASGATAVYLLGANVASAQATTTTDEGQLEFNVISGGTLGSLASANISTSWSASTFITGSDSWTSMENVFRYKFDLELNSSAFDLTPGILPDIGLNIEDGNGTDLYSAANIGQLLGIVDLSSESFNDVLISFDYDPASGPLKITWSGTVAVTSSLLNGSEANVVRVQNGSVLHQHQAAVPEPTAGKLLVLAAAGVMLNCRRRRMVGKPLRCME